MKRTDYLFQTGLLLAVFAAVFLFFSGVLRFKAGGEIDMVHSFYSLERDTVDVLALGSSHMYYSFQPNLLWEEYGMTSYALGSPSQSFVMSYFLLKEALNYQKPKVVLMESYYIFSEKPYKSEEILRMAFDGMKYGEVKKEAVETLFPKLSLKEKVSWYIPFFKYHGRWEKLKAYDFHSKPYLRGGKLDTRVYQNKNMGLNVTEREIPDICLEYLNKIINLCKENGIELIVYATPYATSAAAYEERMGPMLALEKYLEEIGIPFLFLQKSGVAGLDYGTDFCDWAHLNLNGQKKVTSYLGSYLSEHYGILDHRGDQRYMSYENDYKLYIKDVENGNVTEDDGNG